MTLQEYKENKAAEFAETGIAEDWNKGFDAALSLNLPILFHHWYIRINKMGSEERVRVVQIINGWNIDNLYSYFINNVLKFEQS